MLSALVGLAWLYLMWWNANDDLHAALFQRDNARAEADEVLQKYKAANLACDRLDGEVKDLKTRALKSEAMVEKVWELINEA